MSQPRFDTRAPRFQMLARDFRDLVRLGERMSRRKERAENRGQFKLAEVIAGDIAKLDVWTDLARTAIHAYVFRNSFRPGWPRGV